MKKALALFAIAFAALLTGCGGGSTPTIPVGDPGRITALANSEIVVKKMGDTNTVFIGDIASKTCIAKATEIRTSLFGTDVISTSIAMVPAKACGFEEVFQKTQSLSEWGTTAPAPWMTFAPCAYPCTPCQANALPKKKVTATPPCAATQPPAPAASAPKG